MLKENKKLHYLNLQISCTGDDKMTLITEGLQHNDTLECLNAGNCGLTIQGTYI